MKAPKTWSYLALGLLAIPVCAWANPGTALDITMDTGNEHLVYWNLLMGLGEGAVLALLFRVRMRDGLRNMVVANYFSGAIGSMVVIHVLRKYPLNSNALTWVNINNLSTLMWEFIVGLIVITAILEWPFCYYLAKRPNRRFGHALVLSLLASLLVQTASYSFLMREYEKRCIYHVYDDFTVDRSLSFARAHRATIYFMREDGLYKIHTDGTGLKKLLALPTSDSHTMLGVDGRRGDKYMTLTAYGLEAPLSKHFEAIPKGWNGWHSDGRYYWNVFCLTPLDLRPNGQSQWHAYPSTFGVIAGNRQTTEKLNVSLKAPWLEWRCDYVTILPGDQAVARLGRQIVVLDLRSRKMGLVTTGWSPIATAGDEKVIDDDIRRFAKRIR